MKYRCFVPLAFASLVPIYLAAQQATVLPDVAGVFYKDASGGWTSLPTNLLLPEYRGGLRWILSVGDVYQRLRLDGAHASLQVSGDRPTFFVSKLSPYAQAQIVRLDAGRYERSVSSGGIDSVGAGLRFRSRDVVEAEVIPSGDVFAVRPLAALPPGEYLLVSSTLTGARRLLLGSEFGVTR